jgi:hypothetical protein
MPPEIHVKGTVLAGLVRGVGAHVAGPARDAMMLRLDGGLKDAVETNTLGPTVWYPVAWHRQLLGFIAQDLGVMQLSDAVRRSTRENVGTMHRALMRVFSPATLMGRTAMIFRTFFEGQCEAEHRAPGLTAIVWSGCHGFDKNCWFAQLATVEELVAMTGAKQVRRKVLDGGTENDAGMVAEISWRVSP